MARISPDKPASGPADASGPDKSGWLPTEVAVNMLLTRVAFDLLRSDAFRDKVRARLCAWVFTDCGPLCFACAGSI